MQKAELESCEPPQVRHEKNIHFPEGLPAFETVHDFLLIWKEEEAPFLWLQAEDQPQLAFITIDPFLVCPDYTPDVSDEDVDFLKIENQEDAVILSIVNVRNNPDFLITANLLSPLIINWKEKIGKQVILRNNQKYSVRFEIPRPE
jgi:flagellar assembly factor FliW